jgi:hypothetical protein
VFQERAQEKHSGTEGQVQPEAGKQTVPSILEVTLKTGDPDINLFKQTDFPSFREPLFCWIL